MDFKTLNLKFSALIGVSTLLIGCSGYQYVASPRFVPVMEKKGQININICPSGFQAGLAFSNKFSAFATGYRRFPTSVTADPFSGVKNRRSGDSKEINVGLGYYKANKNQVYEVLIGGGFGSMNFANEHEDEKNRDAYYEFSMGARKRNIFIQPNFSYKFKPNVARHLTIAAFTKFNFVRYYDINTTSIFESEAKPDNGIDYFRVRTQADLFFIEPGVMVRAGGKYVKFTGQVAPTINLSGYSLRHNVISLSVGVAVNFNLFKDNSQPEK